MARLIVTLITLDPSTPADEYKDMLSGLATGLQIKNPELEVQWVCATNPEDVFTDKVLEQIK